MFRASQDPREQLIRLPSAGVQARSENPN
jgi:hypothetical protein